MSMDIINIKMHDRLPSFRNEGREVKISDLDLPAFFDPRFDGLNDRMAFWRGAMEIDLESEPTAANPHFSGFDYHGWSAKISKLSESVQRDLMEIQELLDLISNDMQPQPRGLMDEQGPGRDVFDGLEEEVNEVFSELGGTHDVTHSESALADNQSDAYSELTDSYYDGPLDKGPLPYIPDMAA